MTANQSLALYDLLRQHGFEDAHARQAIELIMTKDEGSQLATKLDLAILKADLSKLVVGAIVAMTAIFSLIVSIIAMGD